MTISLAGLLGALIGAVIGVMDYGIVADFLRRTWERRDGGRIDPASVARRDTVLKVAFGITVLAFVALGYWFGVTMAGG